MKQYAETMRKNTGEMIENADILDALSHRASPTWYPSDVRVTPFGTICEMRQPKYTPLSVLGKESAWTNGGQEPFKCSVRVWGSGTS